MSKKTSITPRQELLLSIVKKKGNVTTMELVKALNVSESTVKRDLAFLEKNGYLFRYRGGAYISVNEHLVPSFDLRLKNNYSVKSAIAAHAASLISDGEVIHLGAGTTTYLMVQNIKAKDVTIITESIAILSLISKECGLKVYLLPGEYDPEHMNVCGGQAINSLDGISPDKYFIGAAFINPVTGISTGRYDDKLFKEKLIS